MIKIILIGLGLIITSFFYFPFFFTFLPAVNTKMMMALMGLILLLSRLAIGRNGRIEKDFFLVSLFASGVSFASLLTMTVNNTMDNSYLSYIVSMWVWCGAAYFTVNYIKNVHGKLSVELVCYYMIAVGLLQCLIALAIHTIPVVKNIVYSFLDGWGYMGKTDRMHGIGCALDVGGGRMGVILIMIAYMIPRMMERKERNILVPLFFFLFCFVGVIANMIGRTAIMGMALSVLYWIYIIVSDNNVLHKNRNVFIKWLVFIVLFVSIVCTSLYNTSEYWKEQLRFGFEGFFSLVEKGRWEVQSNEMLKEGLIFPDNVHTWIIGDGYMADPDIDPNYIGPESWGFYMNTDAGYSRFLFYFGIIGLGAFVVFMGKVCQVCMCRFKNYRLMFMMMLLLNYIIWIKVSTDIFLAFAPFLCISYDENRSYEDSLNLSS